MTLLLAVPQVGVTFLIILLVVVFFQVVIHNGQETKRFKKLEEQIRRLEEKLDNK